MKETLQIVQTVVFLFFAMGGGYWLSSSLKKNAAQQRNEHLKSAMTFASQAVINAQKFLDESGEGKESRAVSDLFHRLQDNGMDKYFTANQLQSLIKEAYNINKSNGTLE